MRFFSLFCGGMADEPREELSGRTPLEVAKTPFIDSLLKTGRVGSVNFIPRTLSPSAEIACMALLGYDPAEYYTGLAPLEAMGMGISQDDRDVAFRCDFVTVADDTFVDVAGRISRKEFDRLAGDLSAGIGDAVLKFYPADENRGILIFKDSSASEELDDLECVPPPRAAGQKISKILPQGKGALILKEVVDKAKKILDNHEINRVRIDLKENPANMIWLWGQGKRPKLPAFSERFGVRGRVVSEALSVCGLAQSCGLGTAGNLSEALKAEEEFIFAYLPAKNGALKEKIRRIEEFDAHIVGPVCRYVAKHPESRILLGTDLVWPAGQPAPQVGDVPFLLQGPGIEAAPGERYAENAITRHKRFAVDEGHKLLSILFGKNK